MQTASSSLIARARGASHPRRLARLLAPLGIVLLVAWCVWNPLANAGALAIVTAPNAGKPVRTHADPGETLVDVGPPAATLSVEVVEATTGSPPRGTIFVLHGIRAAKGWMRGWASLLAAQGYRAVLVDLRGHGGSSGDALTYGVLESQDLQRLLDALIASRRVSGPVGAFGVSYGAAAAVEWASLDDRVRAVVAVAPFASLRDVVPGYLPIRLPTFFTNRAIHLAGERGGFDPDRASPLEAAVATHASVLLLHGSADAKIPADHSRRIHAAAPEHTTLVIIPGRGHDDVMDSPEANLASRAPAWFDTHLR